MSYNDNSRIKQYQKFAKLKTYLIYCCLSVCSILKAQPGTIDPTFNVGTGFDRIVKTIVLQPDGRILVGGEFKKFNEQPINGIARLNKDGSLDTTFRPKFDFLAAVNAMALQKDGKIIIGGLFMGKENAQGTFNPRNILRLNQDGSIDHSFNVGTGFSPSVYAISIQCDGNILVGGDFTKFNGQACRHIVRLHKDGSIDPSFKLIKTYDKIVFSIALQPDGKIITSGRLKYLDYDRNKLVQRLNKDGSLDSTFHVGRRFTADVWAVKLLDDGKIMASGGLSAKDTMIWCVATRLNSDGSTDTSFYLPKLQGERGTAFDFAVQRHGNIIISGDFSMLNGDKRRGIIRVNKKGEIDASFNTGHDFSIFVKAVCLTPDNNVVVAGSQTNISSGDKAKNFCKILTRSD